MTPEGEATPALTNLAETVDDALEHIAAYAWGAGKQPMAAELVLLRVRFREIVPWPREGASDVTGGAE